jgi:hypothetical protein
MQLCHAIFIEDASVHAVSCTPTVLSIFLTTHCYAARNLSAGEPSCAETLCSPLGETTRDTTSGQIYQMSSSRERAIVGRLYPAKSAR